MVSLDNGDREFCFNGLPFNPKIAIGEIDSNFGVGYTVQTTTGARREAVPVTSSRGDRGQHDRAPQAPVRIHIAF